MATFPRTASQTVALCRKMLAGLIVPNFPAPPVNPGALAVTLAAYESADTDYVAQQAAAQLALDARAAAFDTLTEDMKKDLRYAELHTSFDDSKLQLIGWGGRSAPTALEVPGACRALETVEQGEGWVSLDWKEPSDGGKPAAYQVQRRDRPAGAWNDVAVAVESEATLSNQERGKEFEYRVLAVNKAGLSAPSQVVMAVL